MMMRIATPECGVNFATTDNFDVRNYVSHVAWWAAASAARRLAARPPKANVFAYINFKPRKLACPSLPTMMWSCTAIPSGAAISTICRVISISAVDGVGSPEG